MRVTHVILLGSLAAVAALSPANAGRWGHQHPRRAEVNARLAHQQHRITEERREGDLTRAQAQSMRATDRSIHAQAHADAQANGGHLTRAQQRTLNAELNANSRAIGK